MADKPINTNAAFAASTAAALMPVTNFAQKRADAAAAMQFEFLTGQLAQQSVEEKQKAIADIQNDLAKVDSAGFLEMDRRRIRDRFVNPFKERESKVFLEQYGADPTRYQRERGTVLQQKLAKELLAHPDYQTAVANMTNYALAQEAKKKGQLLMGNFDQNWQDFANGKTEKLHFAGAYDPPKDIWEHFDKTRLSGYEYGVYRKDPRTGRETYTAPEVTQQHLLDHLKGLGLTPEQATDYAAKLNYQGGRTWNVKTQSPWDAQQQANTERHQRVQEGLQRQGLNLQAENMRADNKYQDDMLKLKKQENAVNQKGVGIVADQLYNPGDVSKLNQYKGVDGKARSWNGKPIYEKPFVGGDIGKNIAAGVGINMTSPRAQRLYNEKRAVWEVTDKLYYESNVSEAYLADTGHRIRKTDGTGFKILNVDTSRILYLPESTGLVSKRIPALKATVEDGDGFKEVLIPVPDTPLMRANIKERKVQVGTGLGLTADDYNFGS